MKEKEIQVLKEERHCLGFFSCSFLSHKRPWTQGSFWRLRPYVERFITLTTENGVRVHACPPGASGAMLHNA